MNKRPIIHIRAEALESLVDDAYKEGWFDGDNCGVPSHLAGRTTYETYQHDWQHSDAKGVLDRYLDPRPGVSEHPDIDQKEQLARVAEGALIALKQARCGQPCSSILVNELIEQLEEQLGIQGI